MFILAIEILNNNFCRFPDEEAGEVPMACVVKHSESRINESQVMEFIAKQVIDFIFLPSILKQGTGCLAFMYNIRICRKSMGV